MGFSGIYMDEFGDFKPSVWGNVIRPALSDRQGWAVFIGTPKGRNNAFHDTYETATKSPDWFDMMLRWSARPLRTLSPMR